MSATTADRQFALVVKADGTFELIEWPTKSGTTLHTLYKAIECDRVDVVDLTTRLSMWVDDEGMCNGSDLNQYASRLYGLHQPLYQPYFGTAVFTGGLDADGETLGLDQDQALNLLTRYLDILIQVTNVTDTDLLPKQTRRHED
ncbi:DUF3846 domain-containing protein [Streptomyces justiciae]|uniref:DUF3846 domain-containing protein n=1 Tax=Streptomyces justiciae TaxID=2780140 RepID=UPI0021177712|nr:DUF3846 domain-containing protein [Streptomyces justiciae]MCW8383979.1 DUF3846 domain-containing protein [Streptomyces justiciae]